MGLTRLCIVVLHDRLGESAQLTRASIVQYIIFYFYISIHTSVEETIPFVGIDGHDGVREQPARASHGVPP